MEILVPDDGSDPAFTRRQKDREVQMDLIDAKVRGDVLRELE